MDPEVTRYLDTVRERVESVFARDVVGIYAIGSLALGGFVIGRSDIDVVAVVDDPPLEAARRKIVNRLSHPSLACPTRGLEFVLYEQEHVAKPSRDAAFALNLNTGPRMRFGCSFDPSTEPAHWFVVDRAIARSAGLRLAGPPPADLFAEIPRPWLLGALVESLRWHRGTSPAGADTVLNALRSWRFTREDVWCSKVDAAQWGKENGANERVVDAALAQRSGRALPDADATVIDRLLTRIEEELAAAAGR